jgi:hypothetical protein
MTTDQSNTDPISVEVEQDIRETSLKLFKQEFKTTFDYLDDDMIEGCAKKADAVLVVAENEGGLPEEGKDLSPEMTEAIEQFSTYFNEIHTAVTAKTGQEFDDDDIEEALDKVNDVTDEVVAELHLHSRLKAQEHLEGVFGKSDPGSVVVEMGFGGFGLDDDEIVH